MTVHPCECLRDPDMSVENPYTSVKYMNVNVCFELMPAVDHTETSATGIEHINRET